MRRRDKERSTRSAGASAASKAHAEARDFRPGNRDMLKALGDHGQTAETPELERSAETAEEIAPSSDPGAGATSKRSGASSPPDVPPTGLRAEALAGKLGAAQSVPAHLRGAMQETLGHDLSRVKVFQGAAAAAEASQEEAQALTVGENIVMGGNFQPGTLLGDALLAHELAHVVHQSEETGAAASESLLENEANLSAAALIARLTGAGESARELMRNAAPRARSGVGVHRCSCSSSPSKSQKAEEAAKKVTKAGKQEAKGSEQDGCPTGDEATEVAEAAAALVEKFGFSGVTASEHSCWTVAELKKMDKAFSRMPEGQQAALKGVELRRVPVADCAGHSADGCFQARAEPAGKRTDLLQMGDAAFDKDKDFDDGSTFISDESGTGKLDLKPSEETALHEAGHAVEDFERRKAESQALIADNAASKAQAEVKAAIQAYNNAFPPAGGFPATSGKAETQYVSAMINWNQELQKATAPTDALDKITNPTKKDFDKAVSDLKVIIAACQRAQKTADKRMKKLPSGSSIRDASLESGFADTQTAAENILTKLTARRDAQTALETARAAEAATQAAVRVSSGGQPASMTRTLAEFVGLLAVLNIDPKQQGHVSQRGSNLWPGQPEELFADFYELSITRPHLIKAIHPELVKFFSHPIGVKDKKRRKKVDAWITKGGLP